MGWIGVEPMGNITPRESALTSVWSCITRDLGQPLKERRQMTAVGDTDWCTLRPDDGVEAPSAYGEGRARARVGRDMTAFRKGRLQGLSCLKGNFHEQFLGG